MRAFETLTLCAVALVGAAARPAVPPSPHHAVLTDGQMRSIVGGVGTATINIPFPQSVVTSDLTLNDVKWNQPGNRCQFNCNGPGPTNVGFDMNTFIFVASGLPAPTFEIFNDGLGRATTTAVFATTQAGYDVYTAGLRTRCVGGSRDGQSCNTDSFCTGGRCATCDNRNPAICNNGASQLAPCATICIGGAHDGEICANTSPDCIPGGACSAVIDPGVQTCYLLSRCGTGSGSGCIRDCTTNGATVNGDSSNPLANGPMHSALARVMTVVNNAPFEISRGEIVYQVVKANGSKSNCEGIDE